ncbi:MAG TPA: hypothetical protein VJ717_11965 [Gemmatimonadaceae bacterium]|nr:hypothetical protein [Gemmatimonadaceae bacterium]
MTEFAAWLDLAGARVFALSATLFVLMNAAAIALVVAKRDRAIVNRWTARWLAANMLLLGAGIGVPIAAKVVRITVDAFSSAPTVVPANDEELERQVPPQR